MAGDIAVRAAGVMKVLDSDSTSSELDVHALKEAVAKFYRLGAVWVAAARAAEEMPLGEQPRFFDAYYKEARQGAKRQKEAIVDSGFGIDREVQSRVKKILGLKYSSR
jgi:hypothetical protein